MAELILADECYQIVGACFEVYNAMGAGFLEAVYQECLEMEFSARGIPYRAQPVLDLRYKGLPLEKKYQPDFVCFGSVVVEIKALAGLTDQHRAVILNYLRATGLQLGLLINLGNHPRLQYERLVWTQ